MAKHQLTIRQENNLRVFVAGLAGKYETIQAVQRMFGNKKINWEMAFKAYSDKAMELMAYPDNTPFFSITESVKKPRSTKDELR